MILSKLGRIIWSIWDNARKFIMKNKIRRFGIFSCKTRFSFLINDWYQLLCIAKKNWLIHLEFNIFHSSVILNIKKFPVFITLFCGPEKYQERARDLFQFSYIKQNFKISKYTLAEMNKVGHFWGFCGGLNIRLVIFIEIYDFLDFR